MSYSGYRGRNIGRVLHFLYAYTHRADVMIFHGPNADPMITLGGEPVANYTWDGDGDVPTFCFLGDYEYLEATQRVRKHEILQQEAFAQRKPWTADEDKPEPDIGWVQVKRGQPAKPLDWYIFRVPVREGAWIKETLGEVRKRADGRWNWRQNTSRYHEGWTQQRQGVAENKEAAQARIGPEVPANATANAV
jgi:hypothetical protein